MKNIRNPPTTKGQSRLSKSVAIWIPRRSLNTFKSITVADLMNPDLDLLDRASDKLEDAR